MCDDLKVTGNIPQNGRPVKRSTGWCGWNTIFDKTEGGNPYMTRIWIGRLRLHIFHRGDLDPDPHDHPWEFWTFPLTPYVEAVTKWEPGEPNTMQGGFVTRRQVVQPWRWSYRPAEHCHRVLGRYSGNVRDPFGYIVPCSAHQVITLPASFEPYYDVGEPGSPARKIVTIVWRGKIGRKWGFLKHRDGRWCWIHWKEYVLGGGKDGPCQ